MVLLGPSTQDVHGNNLNSHSALAPHIRGIRTGTENQRKMDYVAASRQDHLTGTSDIISAKRTAHLGHSDLLEEGFLSPQLLPTETSCLRGRLEDSTQQKPEEDPAQLTVNLNRQKMFM